MIPARRDAWRVAGGLLLLAAATLACTLTGSAGPQATGREMLPLVVLIAPVNGSVIAEGTDVVFYALAQDLQGRIARLEFRVDDIPFAEIAAAAPGGQNLLTAQTIWPAAGRSRHILTVEPFSMEGFSLGLADAVIEVVAAPGSAVQSVGPAVNPGSLVVTESVTPASPAASPAPLDLGSVAGPLALVGPATLNLRQGPGTGYPTVATVNQGDPLQIVGRNADATWWAVMYGDGVAWVLAELVTPQGDVSQVPLVAAPP